MASEYLIHKWRLWFRVLDPKGTGQFSKEDTTHYEEVFTDLGEVDADRKKQIKDALDALTDEFYFRGKPGPITEQEFIDMNTADLAAGKDKFKERMQKCFETENAIFDNGEGFITRETFINAYLGCGHTNREKIGKFFDAYGPKDDKVPVKDVVDSWVLLATNEDSTVNDIVKNALEAGF